MTKNELAREIAQETGITIKDVNTVLESFFNTVKYQVKNGGRVTLRGFASFKMKHRAEKVVRNIQDGTSYTLPAQDAPSCRISKQFLDGIS